MELVRRAYEGGDFLANATSERWDRAFREYLDEEFELRLPDYPEGEPVFRGRDGADQAIAMLREVWREYRFEPERFLDAGERVVVFVRITGKGAASGAPFELEITHVWTIHAGRATSLQAYRDRSQALEAAGLREAMSQGNVELARAQYERWNAEDFDAWIQGFDPNVQYFSSISASVDGSGEYRGHEGMRRFVRDYFEGWESFRLRPVEYIDAGAKVAVVVRTTGRGRLSGVEVERDVAHVWTFRGRRAIRHQSFATREEALEAAGLSE